MIVVIVTFPVSAELDTRVLKEKFLETAPPYQDAKGLIRKNYFADMDDKEIQNFVKSDLTWHKPTKSFGSSENFFRILWLNALDDKTGIFKNSDFRKFQKSNLTVKDKEALKILGLKSDTNWSDIQKKFKTLVKKYHPDKNRGSKKYEDILKKITLAYSQLKVSMKK